MVNFIIDLFPLNLIFYKNTMEYNTKNYQNQDNIDALNNYKMLNYIEACKMDENLKK